MKKIVLLLMVCTLGIMSCKRDYLNVNNGNNVRLYHEETHQIDAEAESVITYKSNNEYHAEVNAQGLVKANYVGKTNVTLTNENGDAANVEIDVIPISNLFTEPNISIGETEASVINKYGIPDVVDDDSYFYSGYSSKAPYLLVLFENGVVESYSVLVDVDSSDIEQLVTFLDERYKYVGDSGDCLFYVNALSVSDATISIGVGFMTLDYEIYAMVAYMNTNDIKSASDMKRLETVFMKYIK
ncbi:MAG: Ig-like domain-containing protein [Bacteroidales bacterium]|nr:Ig-like domain-containing protein [Bacteroidales bacterium]